MSVTTLIPPETSGRVGRVGEVMAGPAGRMVELSWQNRASDGTPLMPGRAVVVLPRRGS
ncbi:MAG: hypothetical protein ACKV2O_18545 [Acidimicrobiales bacterium]